ncbi:hypothetical protein A5784_12825 [Mycobacterium sp. 852013-50091_SCH5140682]|uniref:hypothetical protein n=1 Tax=Mycobacterium sp. 852013-50091_SCH5140682 TaxID=1834109 RepID=UPI0007EB41D6|nr:hypothetical protein [Mycobacterium sp. 852013-50091_SCH5140682]OBC04453.1 hypothetical protein A5784_12825 [Mycobacterium sp. 852013-50091_SCH5140682]
MGEARDDDAPTGVAPTELGGAINETEAHTAWSLDDGEDWPPQRRLTPGRITVLVVAASVALVAVAVVIAFVYLRHRAEPPTGVTAAPTSTEVATTPPSPTETPAPATPPPSPSQPPAPVTLPMDGYGNVHVRTVSGRTVCAMTAGDVQCNVHFTRQLGPSDNGMPASGVGVTSRGAWQWLYGDPGDPDYVTMTYGTVYRAIGWTITPTSEGTTFMNDATGHGMTVSVDGFSAF